MKEFKFIIKDSLGIHARPASLLTKIAAAGKSDVSIQKGEREASCKRLMALMSLGIKCGDEVTVQVDGEDEDAVLEQLRRFFEDNL